MKGWNWRTKKRFPNGELLTPREDVEDSEADKPIFTLWFTVGLGAVVALCLAYWAIVGVFPGSSASVSRYADQHHHGAPTEEQRSDFAAIEPSQIKGDYTALDLQVGSQIHDAYGWANSHGYSWLYGPAKGANRTDSLMVVRDDRAEGFTEIVHAYGCGRHWTTTDQNGAVNRTPGKRETNCNLDHHQTGTMNFGGSIEWGPPSYHPQ